MRPIDAEGMKDWIMKSIPSPTGALAFIRDTLLIAVDEQPTVEPERGCGGWISVKDRLPEIGEKCLIYCDGKMTVGKHISSNAWITPTFFFTPTHWMPLPEPPEEREEDE